MIILSDKNVKCSTKEAALRKKAANRRNHKSKRRRSTIKIIGDFNGKIGDRIKGNMSTVTKGGRQLIKMIDKYDMKIVNEEQEICKGLWTRAQGKNKSVIDYVITEKKHFTTIKGMHIDENKEYATFKIERKESGDIKKYIFRS